MTEAKKPLLARPIGRFLAAHLLAYPLALIFGVAAVPVAILALPVDADATTADVVWAVLHKLHYPMYGVAALQHVIAIPWIFAKRAPRLWDRVFWATTALFFAATTAAAVGTWVWFSSKT